MAIRFRGTEKFGKTREAKVNRLRGPFEALQGFLFQTEVLRNGDFFKDISIKVGVRWPK